MKIDKLLISKLEHLARLEVAPEEEARLMDDLNNILAMVEKLEELNTEGVEPLAYINEEVNVFREDTVAGQERHEAALRNAPDHDDTHFRAPKVIDL